jgi:hypothetical protein
MYISLEKLEKNYICVRYISKISKVSIAHKLIALRLRILIKQLTFILINIYLIRI